MSTVYKLYRAGILEHKSESLDEVIDAWEALGFEGDIWEVPDQRWGQQRKLTP